MEDNWPLEQGRKFESKFFTVEELTAKQQENSWLRNRDAEDGVFTDYPTNDYKYDACYECLSIEELKKAILQGNWAIRQCFTYLRLAFINQINAGCEWWALKKFEDGRLLGFDSMSMTRIINHERKTWTEDYNTTEYEDGSRFRVISPWVAKEYVRELTSQLQAGEILRSSVYFVNATGKYIVGPSKDPKMDFGIYFVDIAQDYFPEWIAQLLKATYEECDTRTYTDDAFDEKWKELHFGSVRRVLTGKELGEALT